MACLIPSGITSSDDSCNASFGGLRKVYLANQSQVPSNNIKRNLNTDVITGITLTGGGKFYQFEFDDVVGAGLEETIVAGTGAVRQVLSFTLRDINQEKKQILSKLKRAKLVAIVQEPNGAYKFAGEGGRGLKAYSDGGVLTISRGVASGDQAGATIALSADVLDYADEVSSSVIASITA